MPYYGQDPESEQDSRGVLPPTAAAKLRELRAREAWTRYDSIVIGQGAAGRSRGWFDTWQQFADADTLEWFGGRDTAAGQSYTNQNSERSDWAQDLYFTKIEFLTPPGIADLDTDTNDSLNIPLLFSQQLPNQLTIRTILADSDEISRAPASHYPAGYGNAYSAVAGVASPVTIGGTNGEPNIGNSWKWPEPITLASKSKLTVKGQVDAPLRQLFASLPGPGTKNVPDGNGGTISYPNWYAIRIAFVGPRYLQLRGARSSA